MEMHVRQVTLNIDQGPCSLEAGVASLTHTPGFAVRRRGLQGQAGPRGCGRARALKPSLVTQP